MTEWASDSYFKYLCMIKTEEKGVQPKPAEFYGSISKGSGGNSQSLSVFVCLYLETIILLTLRNEIIMFH